MVRFTSHRPVKGADGTAPKRPDTILAAADNDLKDTFREFLIEMHTDSANVNLELFRVFTQTILHGEDAS